MSLIDYILLSGVAVALSVAVGIWYRNRKAGKTCGCNCSSCSGNCHK